MYRLIYVVKNRDFNRWILQLYVVMPPNSQYIDRIFSPHYDLAYDITCVVIAYKLVFEHIGIYLLQSFLI